MHTQTQNFTTVRDGAVLLWRVGWNSPLCTVARGAVAAITYGDSITVSYSDGSSTLFRITPNGSNAYPVRTLR